MTTLDIGLDVDNVLYPWSTVFTRWAERYRGLRPGELDDHALSWSWYKDQWGWTTPEMLDAYAAGVHAGVIFTEGDPTPGSLAAVRRLADNGHRIHYVTSRELETVSEYVAWNRTRRWLTRHGFPITSLTVSDDKASVRTDIFLDDAPHNIEALDVAGHPLPLLWALPHNAAWRMSQDRGCYVYDWHEFERAVECLARQELPRPRAMEAALRALVEGPARD